MNKLTLEAFPAFFRALWNECPFDWQMRLVARVRSKGWPSTLDLPTGSGKTAALDIALFALALDAFERPEAHRQPRRIVLVVDRRTVVDQAYRRAVKLAEALRNAQEGVLRVVADALRSLQRNPQAVPVLPAILRGGMPRESEWARTPHQPVLVVSTVDQVGSRLLFRGYGVSDRMKPVHAGLLGCDILYLLDEVHLSQPFEQTLKAVERYGQKRLVEDALPRPLCFVRMSATVREPRSDTFRLTDSDRAQEKLAARLTARKLARLQQVRTPKTPEGARAAIARACIAEVERIVSGSVRAVALIVNRVDTARRAAVLAREHLPEGWEVKLLTGRMRPLDREDLETALLEKIRAGRTRSDERLLVVSTQAIEAGADLDFDALVTECASLDALRQRFGRLDRFGDLRTTEAVIVAGSADVHEGAPPDAIYGNALGATWRWLLRQQEKSRGSTGDDRRVVDFGIDAMDARLDATDAAILETLLSMQPVSPVLVASHLDRWVQTSPIPSADPDVSAFLHGVGRGVPEVQLVWRADLSDGSDARVTEGSGRSGEDMAAGLAAGRPERSGAALNLALRRSQSVREMLSVVPPSALEALSVPLAAAQGWLAAVKARCTGSVPPTVFAVSDVEGGIEQEGDAPSDIALAVVWRGDETKIVRRAEEISPGDTVVVPAFYGGLHPGFHCWDPDAKEPVRDRGDEAQVRHRGRAVARWNADVLRDWDLPEELTRGPVLVAQELEDRGDAAERAAFELWRNAVLADTEIPDWAKLALTTLRPRAEVVRLDEGISERERAWRASWTRRRIPRDELRSLSGVAPSWESGDGLEATTEYDGSSFTSAKIPLDEHLKGVRSFAEEFATALDLPENVTRDVSLSGRLHDLGKADPRFQLWLHGGDPVAEALAREPLAKSAVSARDRRAVERARERSGYPRRARHELTSVALVQHCDELRACARDWDLVLHLIASHHGWCRPFGPPASDLEPVDVKVAVDGVVLATSSDHRLVRIDSGVAERFWRLVRRYGWWRLAWLEAVVRLADHRRSEQEAQNA